MTDLPLALAPGLEATRGDDIIQASLNFVRKHLGMEVAYLSEFVGDDLVFRAVDAPGFEDAVAVGKSMPLEQVYCRHILAGRLPEMIPDTALEPVAQSLALTHAVPIKSHVSVPIHRRDGTPYGMFCCMSRSTAPTLNPRDLDVMRAFANLSAEQINDTITTRSEFEALRTLIETVLAQRDYKIVFQPIMDISRNNPVGFEALCRFQSEPYRPPNLWFDDAETVGLQADLEVSVIEAALENLKHLPEDVYLSVNASPATVEAGRLGAVFEPYAPHRIVLEVTEHAEITNTELLLDELMVLRGRGIRLAVDDAGAGYSGLQQIVRLQPDIIKLDISLTTGLDTDVVRRSLAAALVGFADQTGAKIVAEGIETKGELTALNDLGVPLGQGYLLGKPADLEAALAMFEMHETRRA